MPCTVKQMGNTYSSLAGIHDSYLSEGGSV